MIEVEKDGRKKDPQSNQSPATLMLWGLLPALSRPEQHSICPHGVCSAWPSSSQATMSVSLLFLC